MHNAPPNPNPMTIDPNSPTGLLVQVRQAIISGQDPTEVAQRVIQSVAARISEEEVGLKGQAETAAKFDNDAPRIIGELEVDLLTLRALYLADQALLDATQDSNKYGWSAGLGLILSSIDTGVRKVMGMAMDVQRHATISWNLTHALIMVVANQLDLNGEVTVVIDGKPVKMTQMAALMKQAEQTMIGMEMAKRAAADGTLQTAQAMAGLVVHPGGKDKS